MKKIITLLLVLIPLIGSSQIKLSQLTEATTLNTSDLFLLTKGDVSRKLTYQTLKYNMFNYVPYPLRVNYSGDSVRIGFSGDSTTFKTSNPVFVFNKLVKLNKDTFATLKNVRSMAVSDPSKYGFDGVPATGQIPVSFTDDLPNRFNGFDNFVWFQNRFNSINTTSYGSVVLDNYADQSNDQFYAKLSITTPTKNTFISTSLLNNKSTAEIQADTINLNGDVFVNGVALSTGGNLGDGLLKSQGDTTFVPYPSFKTNSFYLGTTDPTGTTRLNYDGVLHASQFNVASEFRVTSGTNYGRLLSSSLEIIIAGSQKTALNPSIANGVGAVAYKFNTSNTLSTAGAKLVVFENNGTEKVSIDKDGFISQPWGADVASASTITPTGPKFRVTGATTINTINLPHAGFNGDIKIVVVDGADIGTSGNIIKGVGTGSNDMLIFYYNPTDSKWYVSN